MTADMRNPMDVFQSEAPGVARALGDLVDALKNTGGLDEKTRHLIHIAMKADAGDSAAVRRHVSMARQAGAARAEVRDAILLTLTESGPRGVMRCLPGAMAAYDETAV